MNCIDFDHTMYCIEQHHDENQQLMNKPLVDQPDTESTWANRSGLLCGRNFS